MNPVQNHGVQGSTVHKWLLTGYSLCNTGNCSKEIPMEREIYFLKKKKTCERKEII